MLPRLCVRLPRYLQLPLKKMRSASSAILTTTDENRPICNRCKKRNLCCDGPKELTWIYQQENAVQNRSAIILHNRMPGELSFVAFEDDICVAYTRKHLMRGGCVEVACDIVQRIGISDSAMEPGLDLLRNAILGLSAAFYGNQYRQKVLTDRGYRTYGKVLRQLNAHLAQPHLQTTDETILTAMTCMILEIFVPTGPDNFLEHVRGIEAIISQRGPPTSPSGVNPAMITGIRLLCIVGALVQQRPSIWAKQEWRNIPPPHTDEGSLLRHEMLLILADCTVLMKNSKRPSINVARGEELHRKISLLRQYMENLKVIHARWERHNASMLSDDVSSPSKDPIIANHASATTYMLYNTTFICILRIMYAFNASVENLSLQVAASLRIVKCLELNAYGKREGNSVANTIGFVATKVAWETLGGFNSPGGRRLSRAVKAAANGVFAVGAWDKPENSPVPPSLQKVSAMTPLVHLEYMERETASYRAVDLINVGEKPSLEKTIDTAVSLPLSENYMGSSTPGSPCQIFAA